MLRLKRVLDAKGMTIKGSVELLGISEKTLYNKLSGPPILPMGEVKKLRAMLSEYNVDFWLEQAQDSA